MSNNTIKTISLAALALAGGSLACAQAPVPGATVSAPAYSSAYDGWRPFEGEPVQDWRKANERVREVGGWRAYAREIHGAPSQAPRPAATASAPQPAAAQTQPHEGHHP